VSKRPRVVVSLLVLALVLPAVACGGGTKDSVQLNPTSTPDPLPHGSALSKQDIDAFTAFFTDNPLMGGQSAPRIYKWVNDEVAVFLQFDKLRTNEATALRYFGISQKGVFCAEAQPDRSFSHFDRLSAPVYGEEAPPGEKGYWLTAVAVDRFKNDEGKEVRPGVDYDFLPTRAPACGPNIPAADFVAPGARRINQEEIAKLAAMFNDELLTGGQVAPRLYKWVNTNNALFLQFNAGNPNATSRFNPAQVTSLRFVGLATRGEFCKSDLPSEDFPHFHRYEAPAYAEGHGGPPHSKGIWLFWVATESFEQQGREVKPGVDRLNSLIPIEQSC
jgi:hypothetical protein